MIQWYGEYMWIPWSGQMISLEPDIATYSYDCPALASCVQGLGVNSPPQINFPRWVPQRINRQDLILTWFLGENFIWACPKISNPTCWLFIPHSQTDPYVNPIIIQQRTPQDMDLFPSPAVPRWWPRSVPAVEWASSEVHATLNRLWRYLPYKYPYTISMYGLCNTDISKSSKYGYSEYWGELYWILELQKNTVSLFTAHIL